ncbi:hypothetical protein [Aquimarina sp. RZ0]|uniref:hypothetical protein n=1 Tax=Aquimarina sp. RZ0 TaxID=2607730 RepID=UPI0011F2C247|nr:hypothetical protein [Aquimarina sp. RZ0]KAA1242422.1 hypothetical protein F0000_25700 [Aquimarina sp. RZ0]
MNNQVITANNVVEKIFNKVKRFPKEPKYFIRPAQGNCAYEILVNDKLMVKEYGIEQYATPININYGILKTGLQTVTVRLYPLGDAIKDAYGEGETVTTLLPKTQMNIQVVKYDAFNIDSSLDAEKEVMTHKAPTDKEGKFKGAGLPYYEYTFTFDAEVPYELEGWSKGQDLTEFHKDELKTQVVNYYKGIQKIYETKDKDALARLIYGDYLVYAQTKYWTKEDIKEAWEEDLEQLEWDIREYGEKGEYATYDLHFYGHGKLVTLKHPSSEPVDKRLRGESGFWFKYVKGDRIKGRFIWYNLYLPEGEPLENLRVID